MLRVVSFFVNRMPGLVKGILALVGFILARVVRYRSDVIYKNLKNSFGHKKSDTELKQLHFDYYRVLMRYLYENLERISKPTEVSLTRLIMENTAKWKETISTRPTIILASHYGNWEYNLSLLPAVMTQRMIVLYKPLANAFSGRIMEKIRTLHGAEIYPSDQMVRVLAANRGQPVTYVLIADQTPFNMNGVYWNTFLSQRTPWLNGAEKLATRYAMQVVYIHQIPLPEGNKKYYQLKPEIITTDASIEPPGFVTEKYSRLLEAEIASEPEFWLWSHKRWKRAHTDPGT